MFEFEDHHFLEEQLAKAGAASVHSLRNSHRQQVLNAARQARTRRNRLQSLAVISMLFFVMTLFFSTKTRELRESASSHHAPGWPKTIYARGSQVLGLSTTTSQPGAIKTDWNSVQATLKQSCEWGLVDAVVRFRDERAGTIEQIFDRGD